MAAPNTLSAIVLTHRRPGELGGVLSNLINQHTQPNEILVVDLDPAGSGKSAKYLDDPLVRYFCPGEPLGATAGRNFAARQARGDVLLFIEEDARFERFSATRTVLDSFNHDDIACLAFLIRNAHTGEILPQQFPGVKTDRSPEPHDVSYFVATACAVRREVFLELGGYDEALEGDGEAIEFSYRLLKTGRRIWYSPDVLVKHRADAEQAQDAYRLIRNHTYLAVKHLPLPYLLTHVAVWTGYALMAAVRGRQFDGLLRGVKALTEEGLLAHARAYRTADPMPADVVRYLAAHDGRLLY